MKFVIDEGIKHKERFQQDYHITKDYCESAIQYILKKVDDKLERFTNKFPFIGSENLIYSPTNNVYWTSSFWTGMLWLAYELTEDGKYLQVAEIHMESFKNRLKNKINLDTQDLGFLYSLSSVAGYKITEKEEYKEIAIEAAGYFLKRCAKKEESDNIFDSYAPRLYREKADFFVDCLMNLPLLYWAWRATGNIEYRKEAEFHLYNIIKHNIRENGSMKRKVDGDFYKDIALYGNTPPEYNDNSSWSRGQAWSIYGLVLNYLYTGNRELLQLSKKMANYFINRLSDDFIPYWDLIFTEGEEEKDTSAAVIAVCGLFELAKQLPVSDEDRSIYLAAAVKILKTLTEKYTTIEYPESNGILTHGVANKPSEFCINECTIFGDYFYFEALVRASRPWKLYW